MANPSQSGLPLLNTPFLDVRGHVSFPWYAFLNSLHQKSGGATPARMPSLSSSSPTARSKPSGRWPRPRADLHVRAAPQPAVAADPRRLALHLPGPDERLDCRRPDHHAAISRDGGITYYLVSTGGGQLVMLKGDRAQVTWGAGIPSVVWFGGNT